MHRIRSRFLLCSVFKFLFLLFFCAGWGRGVWVGCVWFWIMVFFEDFLYGAGAEETNIFGELHCFYAPSLFEIMLRAFLDCHLPADIVFMNLLLLC